MKFERVDHPLGPPEDAGAGECRAPKGEDGDTVDLVVHLEGETKQALDIGRSRVLVTGALFALAFALIGGRLVDLALFTQPSEPRAARIAQTAAVKPARADIVDRNGILLASSLPAAAVYANPRHVLNAAEAARKLKSVLPEIDAERVREHLSSDRTFVWLHRNLTPEKEFQVNALGLPGIYFQNTERRLYPHGRLAAHVLGLTNIDGEGVAGVEKFFDKRLTETVGTLRLSIDVRVQAMLREELAATVGEFSAIGAAGIVMDVRTGELISLVSLPDFDPNQPSEVQGQAGFNRATKGVYEMGSTFKLFTAAMALDSGAARLNSRYDATKPIRAAGFWIRDYRGKNRWLTVPEVLVYSSNIGAAKMALDIGTERQRSYLKSLGMLGPAHVELPEIGSPLTPVRWREINTMTIAYGHGIAVTPLQLAAGISTIVNGGLRTDPTLLADPHPDRPRNRVISERTSAIMRNLMRKVVDGGTGKNAQVAEYGIGGKTGTAEKLSGRHYQDRKVIASFIGVVPIVAPRYAVLVMVDEPKGIERTLGYATGGWVAAPVVGNVIRRMAPMLGLAPDIDIQIDNDGVTPKTPPLVRKIAHQRSLERQRGEPIAAN